MMVNDDEQWQAWSGLMAQAQEGDLEAYAQLLADLSPMMFGYVRKRVFDPRNVEDVYQDVLMTFHKAMHTYRSERPLRPWLYAVIRNAVWTALKRTHHMTAREVPLEEVHELAWVAPEDDGLDDRLQRALNALPPDNRQAVELLKLKDMSVEEAAGHLGISQIALKVRAHRGYVQLRKMLLREKDHA